MNRRMVRKGVMTLVIAVTLFPGVALAAVASGSTAPGPFRPATVRPFEAERHVVSERHFIPERHVVKEQHHAAPKGQRGTSPAMLPRTMSRHQVRTAAHARGRVMTRGVPLRVRSGPGTGYRVIGAKRAGSMLELAYKVQGNSVWYKLAHARGYVSARYVRNGTQMSLR